MAGGINKKHNIKSDLACFVLFVLLHSFANPVHGNQEDEEDLAKKFAPILVLTENPTSAGRDYKVLNPEQVGIVGANSISNVFVFAQATSIVMNPETHEIEAITVPYYNGQLTSASSTIKALLPQIDFTENKFAFLPGPSEVMSIGV